MSALLVTGGVLATAGGAAAATFGPATGAIAFIGAPSVVLGTTSGSEAFSSLASLFATTGSLTNATGAGSVSGTLDFSHTIGTVIPEAVSNFTSFADTTGGAFQFNVSSVKTLSYSSNPGVSNSVTLYLLGTAGDSNLGLAFAPASETLTVNQTGASAYSASATFAAPPSGGTIPEPASWALMLVGVGLAGSALRGSRGTARAQA
jgi:hypothetical protein